MRLPDGHSAAVLRPLPRREPSMPRTRTSGSTSRRDRISTRPAGVSRPERRPAMVAIEAVLLRPGGVGPKQATGDEVGLWPVFVLVVRERHDLLASSARPLFELLKAPKGSDELTVVTGRTQWTVVNPRRALLRLTVRGEAPVRFEADILVPAGELLGVLDAVARGATIGITTTRHAAGLRGPVDVRAALRHLVLVSCPPATELGELAQKLCGRTSE